MNKHKIPAVPVDNTISIPVEDPGSARWIVKREATAPKPRHNHAKEQLRPRE